MAQTTLFQSSRFSPLTNAVADPCSVRIDKSNVFRRYRAGLRIGITSHQQQDQYLRAIFYEVGRVSERTADALGRPGAGVIPIDASFAMNPVETANLEGYARKYTNFTGQWRRVDLSGIVERLARAIAACGTHAAVDSNMLKGGADFRVVALETLDSPQTASTSSVFIPRTVDAIGSDGTFSVLAAAACGEGATVVTDVVRLDPTTNRPTVPTLTGGAFVHACVDALRVLGANYEASGAGDLFAYAVCRGIHKVVSVVAHTDEGGLFRRLFRAGRFRVPYGGINCNLSDYAALPALNSGEPSAIAAWVDGIALKSAALLAHCDPLVPHNGGLYPTVFAADGMAETAGHAAKPLDNSQMLGLGRQIASDLHRVLPLYTRGLGKLFGLETYSGIAAQHFSAVARHSLDDAHTPDRHLAHPTVAPYFWIEPTSLIDAGFLGSPAEEHGFGSLCTPGEIAELPAFEKARGHGTRHSATHSYYTLKMRSARTSALVCAFAADPQRLNDLKLVQYDTESVVLPGPMGGDSTVRTAHERNAGLGEFLWVRGQSPIPAPAEFINIHGVYGVRYNSAVWNTSGDVSFSDLPGPEELCTEKVSFLVTIPEGLPNGPSNYADREARTERTRAAIGLTQAVRRARALGVSVSPTMETSDIPPTFDDEPASLPNDVDLAALHLGNGAFQAHAVAGPSEAQAATKGAEVVPVVHHKSVGGPALGGDRSTAGVKRGGEMVTSDQPPSFEDDSSIIPSAGNEVTGSNPAALPAPQS